MPCPLCGKALPLFNGFRLFCPDCLADCQTVIKASIYYGEGSDQPITRVWFVGRWPHWGDGGLVLYRDGVLAGQQVAP